MSIRLSLMSAASKLLFKSVMGRIHSFRKLRGYLDFVTKANGINPKGARYEKTVLNHNNQPVPAVWAQCSTASKTHVLLYVHGGGFVFGSADTHKHMVADIAGQLGIRAVLPNYALAPESIYPKGFQDVVNSYKALLDMGYAGRNIIIGGDSAGGCLTFALLAFIKAEKLPMPGCAFTFAALTDLTATSGSRIENAQNDCVLAGGRFSDLNAVYAPDQDLDDPYLSPINADFTGCPPVLLQASKKEMLRDDSERMHAHLLAQGVDAQLALYDNGFHVFQILRGLVPEANQAITQVVDFIRPHISKS